MESFGGEESGSCVVVYEWQCWEVIPSNCMGDPCVGGAIFFI